jgi:hypothetical protein
LIWPAFICYLAALVPFGENALDFQRIFYSIHYTRETCKDFVTGRIYDSPHELKGKVCYGIVVGKDNQFMQFG